MKPACPVGKKDTKEEHKDHHRDTETQVKHTQILLTGRHPYQAWIHTNGHTPSPRHTRNSSLTLHTHARTHTQTRKGRLSTFYYYTCSAKMSSQWIFCSEALAGVTDPFPSLPHTSALLGTRRRADAEDLREGHERRSRKGREGWNTLKNNIKKVQYYKSG